LFANDPFFNQSQFGGPMGGFGVFPPAFVGGASNGGSSFSFSSSSSSGSGPQYQSQTSRTTVINGERVTVTTVSDGVTSRTETVRVGRDGRETREVVEGPAATTAALGGGRTPVAAIDGRQQQQLQQQQQGLLPGWSDAWNSAGQGGSRRSRN
ncbi:hypothetical protein HK405_000875, partial [Cladochytrium tenue]